MMTITGTIIMDMNIVTTTDAGWLLMLATWLSPAYPVGAYSYSHGMEWAVESGQVRDWTDVADYVAAVLTAGGGWSDLVLLATTWRAAAAGDEAALEAVVELAGALRGSAETALESAQQGQSFVIATLASWPGTTLDDVVVRCGLDLAYPVAVGAACAGRVPLNAALAGFGHTIAANLVSAAVRLVPLGQTDGQRALAVLCPVIAETAARAANADPDDLGTATPGIDLCSIRHETQYTRLFRS